MEANPIKLKHRNAYNVTAMNFTPEKIAAEIRKNISGFEIEYEVDPARQAIADSWPDYMDDSIAREEWGWKPEYSLESMTKDMLAKLNKKIHRSDRPSAKKPHPKITKIARGG
jgi:nucleoside-diphosphate-sugar epimerase